MTEHLVRPSGNMKTVCVSAVLSRIGVPEYAYHNTWNARTGENVWPGILRRHGYAVRSRTSKIKRGASVGAARKAIRKLTKAGHDPKGTLYIVSVKGHILLLDADGRTIVDTAPRKRDTRKVHKLYAVWPRTRYASERQQRAAARTTRIGSAVIVAL